jgi:hypothetical protein
VNLVTAALAARKRLVGFIILVIFFALLPTWVD